MFYQIFLQVFFKAQLSSTFGFLLVPLGCVLPDMPLHSHQSDENAMGQESLENHREFYFLPWT